MPITLQTIPSCPGHVPSFQPNTYSTNAHHLLIYKCPLPAFLPLPHIHMCSGETSIHQNQSLSHDWQRSTPSRHTIWLQGRSQHWGPRKTHSWLPAAPRTQQKILRKQQPVQQNSSSLPMACAQEGTEISRHVSQQCPGDGTVS